MGANAPAMYITMLPVWYAIFSAILGTQSVLFSKTLSTLVRATATGDNQVKGLAGLLKGSTAARCLALSSSNIQAESQWHAEL